MSDNWILIIPTEPDFVPKTSASTRGGDLLAQLAPVGPSGEAAQAVDKGHVVFVDAGANFSRVFCPICNANLDLGWWSDRMDAASSASFSDLSIRTPCCDVTASLNDLNYDWPQGFARWRLEVMNPLVNDLSAEQLSAISDVVGCKVRAVYLHL